MIGANVTPPILQIFEMVDEAASKLGDRPKEQPLTADDRQCLGKIIMASDMLGRCAMHLVTLDDVRGMLGFHNNGVSQ